MYGIEVMVTEHDNILKLIDVINNACCGILEGKPLDIEDFENMVSFAKNYADSHHHGKEEKVLFPYMIKHLGKIGENLISYGMLVEHDLGRLYLSDVVTSLERYKENPQTIDKLGIIAGIVGYANLLKRHIEKENEVVFQYAEKNLPREVLESVEHLINDFEETAEEQNIQKTYLGILNGLVNKYC